jgi:NitT/TauT family transport system substrate-binding protein
MACLALVFIAMLGIGGLPVRADGAAAPRKIVVAYAAMNARVAALWVARERGFFVKNGFDADPLFVRGAPTLVAAMTSGEIDVGYTGGTAVVGAVASGADFKILSALNNRVTYELVVKPSIKTSQDLKGKRFGIQAIGGTVWMGGLLGLEHLGLDPDRDKIGVIAVGDQVVMAQALASGTIDAAVLDGVLARPLNARGFPTLVDLGKANLPLLSNAIVVRDPYLHKNPDLLEGVLKAVIEGAAFALSPTQKPATLKILQKYLRISEKEAEEGYRDMVVGYDRKPYASAAGVNNVVRFMKPRNPTVEKVKAAELIDDRLLKKLDQSGFIDETYAKYGVK